jgi:hypothetical protein
VLRQLLLGAAAGAAGTTALNATTDLDMAVRGRGSSSTPEQTVEAMARAHGTDIPGEGEERRNRLSGLGPLTGVASGVGVGLAYGLLDALHAKPPARLGALLAGAGAMAVTNGTMAAYDVTHPAQWGARAWASDLVPHLVYGGVLAATYEASRA